RKERFSSPTQPQSTSVNVVGAGALSYPLTQPAESNVNSAVSFPLFEFAVICTAAHRRGRMGEPSSLNPSVRLVRPTVATSVAGYRRRCPPGGVGASGLRTGVVCQPHKVGDHLVFGHAGGLPRGEIGYEVRRRARSNEEQVPRPHDLIALVSAVLAEQ